MSKVWRFSDNAEEHDKHMLEHNKGAQFFCTKCGVHFHGSRQYEQHLDAHTRHDCLVCGKRLPTHKLLVKHCKNVHDQHVKPEERIWYSCDHCDKKFSRPNLLEVHMRIHTGEKPVECSICKIFFRTTKALAKHRQTYTHTIKAGEKPTDRKFLCSECGKAYFRKHALQRHMRYHTGDKPHMCQYCGYKCREVNNLKRHMSLHFEGERNFVCEVCGAAFHAKKTLEMHHAYKHSEERNFACSECMLTFKAKNALKRHMKVHTCEKDHKCWCGTAFKRMYNLRRHLKAVHGTDDLLPPVRRVQTLDKVTKKPVPKPEKVQQPNLQSQNLKREIENLITETSNLSRR
ncbi:hypothetical protein KUTeg_017687 [Tegillarca granosa]|uniref:C2H2-type domain-containing protein n=1 Tax=Tegillarca granosa TaxID=220873 RepID=A0ABQ9EFM8_TEGGR|nr:hypothetical protein KUTeg_017687 [Tegillarca granosa]